MPRKMFPVRVAIALALFGLVAWVGTPAALAAGVVGNGSAASCTETALNNRLAGGGLVTFNCGPNPKTIVLTATKQISVNTTIDGGNKITLKAQNTYHLQIFNGVTFSLKNITLSDSNGITSALENFGTTNVSNVIFKNNSLGGTNNGGAIYNSGTLKINNSTFKGNRGQNGGAIYNSGGTLKVNGSTFDTNQAVSGNKYGGAIANDSGTLIVKKSKFLNNAAGQGGAVHTDFGTTNTLKSSTFDSNQAADSGGAIANFGTTVIAASTLHNNTAGNTGGGITHGGNLTMQTTTLSGNHASSGAGMRDFGNSTTILTSTFSGNIASGHGGGIYSSANTVLRNSTLSGNRAGSGSSGGGGLYQYGGGSDLQFVTIAKNKAAFAGGVYSETAGSGSIQMENVLLSGNQNGNCGGSLLVSLGGNLSSDTYCSVFTQSKDKQNKNAKLGALANNGGPTQTHMLLAGSPAINNGLNIAGITKDQRGSARPKGSAPDTGAVEAQ